MPANSDLLIPASMRQVEVESVTSEGTPIENAFDWNPDTYWKPTTTGVNAILMDLQSAYDIDGLALFIRNYNTDIDAEVVELSYSDNGSTWTIVSAWGILSTGGAIGDPIKIFPEIDESAHRWWRVTFGGVITEIIEVAQIILYNKTTFSQGNQFPEHDEIEYPVTVRSVPGRRTYKKRTNVIPVRTIPREWLFTKITDYDALNAAIDQSLLGGLPMLLVEGSDRNLVEIIDATFNKSEIAYATNEPVVTFRTLPFNEDGAGY